jgi:GR25 family glycosyltransferase involved in LPS biosynthesis/glycosyltransferase involved in cell wall biosynthesis
MIVRDAADFISETLESVLPYIDEWIVVDTGSLDNTKEVVQNFFDNAGLNGQLVERPWIGFSHNRTEAIALCAGRADYAFMIDADDLIEGNLNLTDLTAPGYRVRFGPHNVYWRPALFSLKKEWEFRGAVHEYAVCLDGSHTVNLEGDYNFIFRSLGNRGKDPLKFQRDIDVLLAEYEKDSNDPRTVFYLAQSYRDFGDVDSAITWYRRRVTMPGWVEENFIAALELAKLLVKRNDDCSQVVKAFENAWRVRPSRAEALVELAKFHRENGNWFDSYLAASRACQVPFPADDLLFVDASAYDWRALDEFAIAAGRLGLHDEAIVAGSRLLESPLLPFHQRERVLWNQTYSMKCLGFPQNIVRDHPEAVRSGPTADLTFTITTCRRRELFERTMDSFLENCLDHHLISRWICIDDASSSEDRQLMAKRYPFFEFIYKDNDEVGHAKSMNRLLSEVTTKYWLHFEDDWQVIKPGNYISYAMAVLDDNDSLIQCVLNRNYAEILDNYNIVGGHLVVSQDQKTVYRIHDYINPASPHFQELLNANPGRLTNAYWPGFSLMPSLLRRQAFDDLGSFNPGAGHFERDMADRALKKRWLTACIDDLTMLNIGRLRIETNPDGPLNAYQLLGVDQFANYEDITVGIVTNWTDGDNVVRQWQRQFPNNGAWKGVRLVPSDVDAAPHFTLVINHPRTEDLPINASESIVVHMEPREGTSRYGDWAQPNSARFMHVHSRDFATNFLEWHLDISYDQLATTSPTKSADLSAIVTGKRLSPGHHFRLDLIHHLESIGQAIDIFGLDNNESFRNYRGALPWLDKREGLAPYRYTIAIENNSENNYVTEKLVDAILSECLPFYWGCPNLEDIIEPDSYIRLPLDDLEASASLIQEAIANDEYSRRLPAIKRSKENLLNSLQIAPTISRLVRGHKLLDRTPIHVINLDRRPDRLDGFMQRLALASGDRLTSRIERFPAIDGQDLEMTPEIMHMFRGSELPLRRSQTACALSHLSLWIELINSEHDHYIIFEDDAHFTSDFTSRIGELLGQMLDRPQPDVIFLGLHYFDDAFSPKSSIQTLRPVVLQNLMGGTFGYIISRPGAKKLFDIAQTEGIAYGIDTFVLLNSHRVQSLEVVPNFVSSPVARLGGPSVDTDIQYEDL